MMVRGRVIFRLVIKVVIKVVIWDFRWIGKAGTEFFTGSQDGYMKWWDIRSNFFNLPTLSLSLSLFV